MFRTCIEAFVRNLELYPQDEADLLLALFTIGQKHGKFVVHLVQEASEEIEPSPGVRFVFESHRAITMLILAVSAPVSFKRCICSVAPRLFSFAVTLLERISRGLAGIMDRRALLAYLCRCSQFTYAPISEFYEGGGSNLTRVKYDQLSESCQGQPLRMIDVTEGVHPFLASSVKMHDEATDYVNIILKNTKDLWPLTLCGRSDEFYQHLRTWKRELNSLPSNSLQATANLLFALRYLRIIKLLGRIWMHCIVFIQPCSNRVGKLEISLGKLQRVLGEVQQRFTGFSKQEGAHILELILVSHTLNISFVRASCPCESLKKMRMTLSSLEELSKGSMVGLSEFVTDVQKVLPAISPLTEESIENLSLLQNSLNCFSLRKFVLSGVLKAPEVELDISNSYENPLRYISGLPAGIPVEIRLRNVLLEHRLWLKMTGGEKLNQFVFVDLDGIGCGDDFQKFSLVVPFYRTPATSCFVLKISVGIECSTDLVPLSNCNGGGPRDELFYINSDKEVYLTRMDQQKS